MPVRWLFKTEPSTFSYDDLLEQKRAVWDGVANAAALIHLRNVRKGDLVLVYHTGSERQIVGEAGVAAGAYPDPKVADPRLVVVDLVPGRRWKRPLSLAQIKSNPALANFDLVRLGRLSVMPVADEIWRALVAMAASERA